MRKLLSTLTLCTLAIAVSAQSTARKFTLKNSDDGKSELTVYLPSAEKATGMAIVGLPGGGYRGLATAHEGHDWAEYYNAQGIAYAVLVYRMPNGDRNIPLSDAYNAMKTMRDSAAVWHINPRAVGIMGSSAGGHLASAVSTHAPLYMRPNFSVLFYPVISMDQKVTHKGSCQNFLGEQQNDKEVIKEWSSDRAVRRHLTPPAIIITANDDGTVPPVTNGIAYYSAMRNAGNDCSLYVYPTGGHGFGFRTTWRYHNQMLNDLTEWLNTLPIAAPTDKKIACVGNSITDGHGIDMCDKRGYPALLQKRLGKGYEVKNFGVSARTLMNSADIPYQNELAWRDCLDWQPDVVVIKLGTNDSKEQNRGFIKTDFAKDLQIMIDSLRALPTYPRIYLATPIKAFKQTWTINEDVIANEEIPIIIDMAKKNQCELIDLHTLFGDDASLVMSDGIHPNDKGVAALADIVAKALNSEPVYPNTKPVVKAKNKKKRKK